ncbi:Similar to Uncharacterized protein YMR244W; acc. no. Q04018 [Pyronema omphalodes CBS 100304]|uniref:Similar to Uncharacterized protein YMR244W acc. no. Q04018 n=1 Tax=Pyronema omphalodes (strain CBS 100304) TaxID=1076935 RepID=U4KVD1_PYROM|nr:Similar to Uncharacterized protein YMR244W; acc. no. Q04018 [Pyronema omphalodes CBS 100304]
MRSTAIFAFFSLLLAGEAIAHDHGVMGKRHAHHRLFKKVAQDQGQVVKRGTCEFPKDEGLVAVTPDAMNAGWAMSPDQPCRPGNYCPYACPPGQLMAQWSPKATSYKYPESMDGGLYCDENGQIHKPFPNKPYCYDGVGTVTCKNKAPKPVAFCQTVLPGNEAMLIPTNVDQEAVLAVPDTKYWAGTAAHHEEACVWGTKDKPIGNWSPYVAGANAADSGETFVKLGWNPIYIEPDVKFRDIVPDWGVRIECDGACSGLPCEIDPSKHQVNECSQKNTPGAGGANFCVVGVPKGVTATIVVFSKEGENSPHDDIKVGKPISKPELPVSIPKVDLPKSSDVVKAVESAVQEPAEKAQDVVKTLGSQNESGNQDAEEIKPMQAVSSTYVSPSVYPSLSSQFSSSYPMSSTSSESAPASAYVSESVSVPAPAYVSASVSAPAPSYTPHSSPSPVYYPSPVKENTPPTYSSSSFNGTDSTSYDSSSSGSSDASSTSASSQYSQYSKYASDKSSNTLTLYYASASGYPVAPTNGTIPGKTGSPSPIESQTSSASSTTLPALALFITVAYSILLL